MGRAYAVFDCNALIEEIKSELPYIRSLARTPAALEVAIIEATKIGGSEREKLARAHIKYVIQAVYPDMGNREAAIEVAAILNQAYLSPLYPRSG